ncbi:MAG: hypothetical protein HY676_01425 [Chloroflexi bacterium]|nr:hypothetical protein [Chloroflexota bacterium]
MSGLGGLAYIVAALAFLVVLAGFSRWWRRKTRHIRGQKSFAEVFSRRPKIKWPGKRLPFQSASESRSHFPRCPICGTASRPSPLEGRFECPHCGRLFS